MILDGAYAGSQFDSLLIEDQTSPDSVHYLVLNAQVVKTFPCL